MKLSPLRKRQHKKVAKLLLVIFPFFGFWLLWKLFSFFFKGPGFYEIRQRKTMLGFMAITTWFFFHKKFLYLKYFAIDPAFQSQGKGQKALKILEEKARAHKHDYLLLTSQPWRKDAHKFYEKNGFKKILGFLFWKRL